jgi:hypothetical protein
MAKTAPKHGWWIVSRACSFMLTIVDADIDAVFAESADEAMELASQRNYLRPRQVFAIQRTNAWGKRKAVRLNEVRTSRIAEIYEIMRRVGIEADLS